MHQNRNYIQFNFMDIHQGRTWHFRTTKMRTHQLKSPGNDKHILSKKLL